MAAWTETRLDRWTHDGSIRHSVEKLSFWFASFDGSYGCLLDSRTFPGSSLGLKGRGMARFWLMLSLVTDELFLLGCVD
ncbi:hypothetical protein KC19_9G077500 [Ceratodon purpureus]|uniref:Uncharacterized protein n=1 Tax=Ceratodon purpureus TaxID=3225 RepID=A0A8T0GT68_CERPU|nr:hypothetical protein KC19_9G077500 [Ceratodon purpureus]